eukprot:s9849_g1.t1
MEREREMLDEILDKECEACICIYRRSVRDYRRRAEAEAYLHREIDGIRCTGGDHDNAPRKSDADIGLIVSVPHSVQPIVLEDNQATIRILESGVARPPLHLAQQRSLSPDRQSFQPLAPVAVAGFLEGYGYEARADLDVWALRPGSATAPVMAFEVAGHEERGGHTWYQMKCSLMAPRSVPALRWKVERRLSSLREELHDRIKDSLGSSYANYFGKTPFALKGGLPGTTARLNLWFGSLAEVVNRGDAQPSVVALLLLFLEAPEPSEPTASEPTQEAEARRSSPGRAYTTAAPVEAVAEDPPSDGLSPTALNGAGGARTEASGPEEAEIEISLEDETNGLKTDHFQEAARWFEPCTLGIVTSRELDSQRSSVSHAIVGMAPQERQREQQPPGGPGHSGSRLSRLPELLPSLLSEAQRALYDRILSGAKDASGKPLKTRVNEETGGLLGPFNSFLRSPELGGQLATLAETLRFGDLHANQRLLEQLGCIVCSWTFDAFPTRPVCKQPERHCCLDDL